MFELAENSLKLKAKAIAIPSVNFNSIHIVLLVLSDWHLVVRGWLFYRRIAIFMPRINVDYTATAFKVQRLRSYFSNCILC